MSLLAMTAHAATDATVTFRVTTLRTNADYDPKNIMAIWVVDGAGGFVKTLKKRAQTRQQYLYRWLGDSGGNVVDAITGATLSTQETHNVTWNCRNTSGAIVNDGNYRIRVEYTTSNGQGPYTTNWCGFVKGTVNYSTNYANLNGAFNSLQLTYTLVTHDIAVQAITPTWAPPNTIVPVGVLVTNKQNVTESFTTVLSNTTMGTEIARRTIGTLAGRAATNVVLNWNTTNLVLGIYTLTACATSAADESATYDNTLDADVTVRLTRYDLAVVGVQCPRLITPGATVPITVTATNKSDNNYACTITLHNATENVQIGKLTVASLRSDTATNAVFSWATAGLAPGYRTLRASVSTVANETNGADNTNIVVTAVAAGTVTSSVVAAGAIWQYHDQGLDLSGAPWHNVSYFDGTWQSGTAPLGYGGDGEVTVLDYGSDAANKYPTYYFRQGFSLPVLPLSAFLRVRRDDGVIAYVNGIEILRDNMPAGAVAYGTWASTAVSGAGETNYFDVALDTAAFSVPGYNILAAEVHQVSSNSTDVGFDAALIVELPDIPLQHDVALHAFSALGGVQAGDLAPLRVTAENNGTAVESFSVVVKDTATATTRASANVAHLAPGAALDIELMAATYGLTGGMATLEATAGPVAGETNTSDNSMSVAVRLIAADAAGRTTSVAGALGGYCAAVAVDGATVYAGEGAELRSYDVSTPAQPTLLGRVQLPGVVRAVAVIGQHVIAACGDAGMCVVNVSNAAAPAVVAIVDTSGDACAAAVDGTTVYLADSVAGVRIIDLSAPTQPQVVGVYHSKGPAQAVAIAGTILYVLDAHNGLDVVDVSNPAAPARLGTCDRVVMGRAMARSGNTLYTVDGAGYLSVIGAATPIAPTLQGRLFLPSPGRDITVAGTTAYIPSENAGLIVADVSAPGALLVTNVLAAAPDVAAVALNGSSAFAATGFDGLLSLSLAAPTAPAVLGSAPGATRARATAVADGILFAAGGNEGVRIYSLTNSSAPVLLGAYTNALNAMDVAVVSQRLFVADAQFGMQIADVSAPAAPVHLGGYSSAALRAVRLLCVQDSLALLCDGFRCELLNVANPASPAFVAAFSSNLFIHDAVVTASNVYLAAGANGVLALTYSAAGPLTLAQRYATPGHMARGITALGARVYVADDAGGWLMIDGTQPASPTSVTARPLHASALDVVVSGNRIHVLENGGGVHSFDAALRLMPVERRVLEPLARALRATGAGRYTVLAQDAAGAALLDTSPDDTDLDGLLDSVEFAIINADPGDGFATLADVQPQDDFDGDRMSNYAENIAGTDPTDPLSVFIVQRADAGPSEPFVVRWSSVNNKTYTVHAAGTPAGAFTPLQSGIAATPPVNEFTDVSTNLGRYYLITVE